MPDASIQSPKTRPVSTKSKTTSAESYTAPPSSESYNEKLTPNATKKCKGSHNALEEDKHASKRDSSWSLPEWNRTITSILNDAGVVPYRIRHVSNIEGGCDVVRGWTRVKLASELEEKLRSVVVEAVGKSLEKLEFAVVKRLSLYDMHNLELKIEQVQGIGKGVVRRKIIDWVHPEGLRSNRREFARGG